MDKITIYNDEISKSKVSEGIKLDFVAKNDFFSINSIKINVYEDTELEIDYKSDEETKLDLFFHIHKNANLKLFEKREGSFVKVQYKYYIDEASTVSSTKIYDSSGSNELCIVNLNGQRSKFDLNFKTIATNSEKYTLVVNHNASKTISDIKVSGISIEDGAINVNMTGLIPKGKEECELHQNGRLITFNENDCVIKPNLFIEEESAIANHSASIGGFKEDEVFYLMSRGIDYDTSINLLTKGFLLKGLDIPKKQQKEIKEVIDNYWR